MKAEFQPAHSHGLKMLFSAGDEILCQVTNYPKFLRDIELYGRSEITHMEERIIDFPEDLQDLFDKNPEVLISQKYSDSPIDFELSDLWEQPGVHEHATHPDEERGLPLHHSKAAGGSRGPRLLKIRYAKLQLVLDKRNIFLLFFTQKLFHTQATSDIRENPLVTVLGSHAAMTCQIVVG